MMQKFTAQDFLDANGKPAGGHYYGCGFAISWQNGPLGRAEDRKEPNGAFVQTIIAAAVSRLGFYQSGQFKCDENELAIQHLLKALESLTGRTNRRELAGVEGTHAGS